MTQPTIRMLPDLTVTLKGINYDDLRSILTAASIHHYETEKEIAAKKPSSEEEWLREIEANNIADEKAWCKHERELIDSLLGQINSEITRRNRCRKRKVKE